MAGCDSFGSREYVPVCSENRTTTARLVEYKPAQTAIKPTQQVQQQEPFGKPAKPVKKEVQQ